VEAEAVAAAVGVAVGVAVAVAAVLVEQPASNAAVIRIPIFLIVIVSVPFKYAINTIK
jgi:hypothetical protein